MSKKLFWRVAVTYGNAIPNATYARVPSQESANILRDLAVSKGYRDARVVREDEKVVRKGSSKDRRGQADSPRVDRAA